MSVTSKTRLEEIKQLLRCAESQRAYAIRIRDNDEYYKRQEEILVTLIERKTKELERLRATRAAANSDIDQANERIKELGQMYKHEEHVAKIEKLKKLQAQIEELATTQSDA